MLLCAQVEAGINILSGAVAILGAIVSCIMFILSRKERKLTEEAKKSIVELEKQVAEYYHNTKMYRDEIKPYYEKGADFFEYQSERVRIQKEFESECEKVYQYIKQHEDRQIRFAEILKEVFNNDSEQMLLLREIIKHFESNEIIRILKIDGLSSSGEDWILIKL